MPPTAILDYETTDGEYVESVTVIRTDASQYPSGWKYSLHYGTRDGTTLLRYDNAHEHTKGHERHTRDGIAEIEFPGMTELYRRFQAEIQDTP